MNATVSRQVQEVSDAPTNLLAYACNPVDGERIDTPSHLELWRIPAGTVLDGRGTTTAIDIYGWRTKDHHPDLMFTHDPARIAYELAGTWDGDEADARKWLDRAQDNLSAAEDELAEAEDAYLEARDRYDGITRIVQVVAGLPSMIDTLQRVA